MLTEVQVDLDTNKGGKKAKEIAHEILSHRLQGAGTQF
mgnify:CR=1 FL=1